MTWLNPGITIASGHAGKHSSTLVDLKDLFTLDKLLPGHQLYKTHKQLSELLNGPSSIYLMGEIFVCFNFHKIS